MNSSLGRRATAEFVGTGLLVAAVVGSGIMGERLANGNIGLELLSNTVATGAALVCLIIAFGSISGAHFNPVVTLMDAFERGLPWRDVPHYLFGQILGAFTGAVVANLMFGLPAVSLSAKMRNGSAQLLSEFIATFGLMCVIWGASRLRPNATPFAVGAYITSAYWFTASTSFANPAVTMARCFSNTFAGIRPQDAPQFMAAQFAGGIAATLLFRWLVPHLSATAAQVLVPRDSE
jgi:glycerol uptake facilitator-like aquaporin